MTRTGHEELNCSTLFTLLLKSVLLVLCYMDNKGVGNKASLLMVDIKWT